MNVLALHERIQINFLVKNWNSWASDVTRFAYFLKASHIWRLNAKCKSESNLCNTTPSNYTRFSWCDFPAYYVTSDDSQKQTTQARDVISAVTSQGLVTKKAAPILLNTRGWKAERGGSQGDQSGGVGGIRFVGGRRRRRSRRKERLR